MNNIDIDNISDKVRATVSPLLIKVLLKGGIDKEKIDEYLKAKGYNKTERRMLYKDSEIYDVDMPDTESVINMVVIDSMANNKAETSLKALDMLNKMKGAYNNEVKIKSDEPVTITFN